MCLPGSIRKTHRSMGIEIIPMKRKQQNNNKTSSLIQYYCYGQIDICAILDLIFKAKERTNDTNDRL